MSGLITVGGTTPVTSEIEFGTYRMRLTGLSQKTITVDAEDRDVFEWVFGIPTADPAPDDHESDIKVNGLTSTMTGPKSKTMSFVSALLWYTPETGTELNPPDLLGKWALGKVGPNKNGYPKVEDLMPEPKAPAAAAKPAEPEVAATPAPAATVAAKVSPIRAAEDDLPF